MKYTYENLKSIVLEEAAVSAIENTYQTEYMLVIETNGLITKTIFNKKEEYYYYNANVDDIKALYEQVIDFIDNVEDIELYNEDCVKDIYVNYDFVSIKVPAASYNKDKIQIGNLINEFVENKCTKISK